MRRNICPEQPTHSRFPTSDVIFYYNKENYSLRHTKKCLLSNPWPCLRDEHTHFLDNHLAIFFFFFPVVVGSEAHFFLMDLESRVHEGRLFLLLGL